MEYNAKQPCPLLKINLSLSSQVVLFLSYFKKSEKITDMISVIEKSMDLKAKIKEVPMPKADVVSTFADTRHARERLNYQPSITLDKGMKEFVNWYKTYPYRAISTGTKDSKQVNIRATLFF